MKKILTMLALMLCTIAVQAQVSAFNQAVAKYRNVSSLSASATKTKHRQAVTKDVVTKGQFYVKGSDKVLITFDEGKDALLMNGDEFTMTIKGRKFKKSSKKDAQFKTFHDVLQAVFDGGKTDLSKHQDVKIVKNGNIVTVTIAPSDAKAAKRSLFTSFALTIDARANELRTLRINEKKGYTEYAFSGYKLGASVADSLFK